MNMARIVVAVVVMALLLSACGSGGGQETTQEPTGDGSAAAEASVTAVDFSFQPDSVTVAAGSTVTWTNEDEAPHTVTAGTPAQPAPDEFDLPLDEGTTAEFTFEESGTFDYYCTIHPDMQAEVVVE